MNVADIIYAGYRIAGILAEAGRGYSASERDDGLDVLNAMVDTWKSERLMVYAILRSVFNLIASKATYSIGESGTPDIAVERPERIEHAGYINTTPTPNVETPLHILTPQEWAAVSSKAMTCTIPGSLYYQPTVPNGTLTPWPKPTSAGQIALYTWQTVNRFATASDPASDPVTLAPAYQEAMEYNLAIRLAARFPERQKLSQLSIDLARQALAKVKSMNAPELQMQIEAAAQGVSRRGHWSIFTNSYQ